MELEITIPKLEIMLRRQEKLQLRLDPDFLSKTTEERVAFIKEHSIHLNQEVQECLYELPFFKPWKDYSGMTEEEQEKALEAARKELIDAWHFFMNIMLALGMDAETFFEMYLKKNDENHKRQDDGYTHDVKYGGYN